MVLALPCLSMLFFSISRFVRMTTSTRSSISSLSSRSPASIPSSISAEIRFIFRAMTEEVKACSWLFCAIMVRLALLMGKPIHFGLKMPDAIKRRIRARSNLTDAWSSSL